MPDFCRFVPIVYCYVASSLLLVGCQRRPPIGDNYPPVTAEQLRRSEFSHRTGREKFDFTWVFAGNTFVIEGKEIPPDLSHALVGPEVSPTRIEGAWQIRDGKVEFLVTDGNPQDVPPTCRLPIYFTGVIRIETPSAQYVF